LLLSFGAFAASNEDLQPCEPLSHSTQQLHDYDDFSTATRTVLGTVESNHFTPEVEQLKRGLTAPLPRDIAFVLRAFPNHYRALTAMATWQLRNKLPQEPESNVWTARCYFERAIAFSDKNARLHTLYAVYLHRAKFLDEAAEHYNTAQELGANGADFFYNRGLLEIDRGNLDAASEYADKAYAMGYPLPGLRDRLNRARKSAAPKSGSTRPKPAGSATPAGAASAP
jgi:tetratricopeptide (TPR) repeat protein